MPERNIEEAPTLGSINSDEHDTGARARSERTPGRHQSGSRVRKVAQRLIDSGPQRDPLVSADKADKSLQEKLAQPAVPEGTLREQLTRQAGTGPIHDGNRGAREARDGEGDVPFLGWFEE